MSSRLIPAGDSAAIPSAPVWRPSGNPGSPGAGGPPRTAHGIAPAPAADMDAQLKAAYQQGRAEAEAAASRQALTKIEPVISSLTRVIQELAGTRKNFRASAEQDTVQLAIAIARRLLHRELSTDPDAILGLVTAAFQKLNARETHRLRVAPSDAQIIQRNRPRMDLPPSFEVLADPSLAPGSAVFETSRGELDASIGTQLAEIDRGFADLVRRRTH